MKRFLHSLTVLSLFFFLAGCQEETDRSKKPSSFPEGTIGFSISKPETRGEPLLQLSELTEFKVIAYQHTGLWSEVSAQAPASPFMEQTSVTQAADNSWSYTPLEYWPANKNLTFFGYAPEAATNGISNQYGLSITTPVDGEQPKITYTVPGTVEYQPDLMVSVSQNYNLNRVNDGANAVNMQLAHALTCIGFKATGKGEQITSIKLSGIVGTGTVSPGNPTVVWDIVPSDTTYIFEAGVNGEALDSIMSNTLNGNGYLMMIPQTLSSQARVSITIDGGSTPYEQTFNLSTPGHTEWQAGQFIEYQFAISPTGSIMLSPENLILPAIEQSYSSFAIICPEQHPDAGWTVSTPNNGWLQICDNPSGNNTVPQTNAYTYSDSGSKTLFVFAPAANTSGAELNSTLILEGSSQQIAIKQLYQGEVYIPKYPHSGWAGSNIYWVVDATYPDGGYLTFDDKGETTHEQYQGVYFLWGSLIALSPQGNNWTGGLWNPGGGQILYIPNANPTTNGGWNPASNSGWKYIPKMGWTNSSNPNGGGSAVNIPENLQQSYLIQNHSPSKNIGDICKYITDMGWAPGAKEGRKWRMPTHTEFQPINDYIKENAPFSYEQSNNLFGQMPYNKGFRRQAGDGTPFFPNSGYRLASNGGIDNFLNYSPGEAFSYWSSSPRGTSGDAFDFININQGPTNIQGFLRDTGATIRCVLENNN